MKASHRYGQRFATPRPSQPTGAHYQPSSFHKAAKKVRPPRVTIFGVFGELLITAGVLVLLFVVWELYYTNIQAGRDQEEFRASVVNSFAQDRDSDFDGSGPDPSVPKEVDEENDPWGILYVPAMGEDFSVAMRDGSSDEVMDSGVLGRYPDSPRPGEEGNLAVAGHRQTHGAVLWDMDKVKPGDFMYIQTANGFWKYEVKKHHIVQPTEVSVLAPNPLDPEGPPDGNWLTITTCHPLYTTLERMVSHAVQVDFIPIEDGPPEEIAKAAEENMPSTDLSEALDDAKSLVPTVYNYFDAEVAEGEEK